MASSGLPACRAAAAEVAKASNPSAELEAGLALCERSAKQITRTADGRRRARFPRRRLKGMELVHTWADLSGRIARMLNIFTRNGSSWRESVAFKDRCWR